MRDVVVLCSGGVDSAVLVSRAVELGRLAALVFCNYGQPAALMEWRAAKALSRGIARGAPFHEVPLTTVWASTMTDPSGREGARIVPVRNLLMVAHAANFAAKIGASVVWYGAIADDAADYHDCRPEWAITVSAALSGDGVRVESPLALMGKACVVAEARARGVLDAAWSCYAPRGDLACGSCNSCRSRIGAL